MKSSSWVSASASTAHGMHFDDVKAALYPGTADVEDFSYERVSRLLRLVGGEPASTFQGAEGLEHFSSRVEPHSPGLRGRMWYGGASTASARWAGEHRMNFLTSSVVRAEGSVDCAAIQQAHIQAFRPPIRTARTPGCRRGWS